MKIFESFNFDIVIILILISSVISGLYFNLYRQGRRTIALILPFIILYFSFNAILNYIKSTTYINDTIVSIINIIKIELYKESTYALIVYFGVFIILNLLVKIVYSMFRVPVYKRVLNQPSTFSKFTSSFLGLINGYVLVMLFMFIFNPLISINYEKPITKFFVSTSNDVITFSNLDRLKNLNIVNYNKYESTINELTGRGTLNHYKNILDTFDDFNNLETEFIEEIIPVLSSESIDFINLDNILSSYNIKRLVILEHEKGKPIEVRLREINKLLEKKIVYLDAYYVSNDFEYPTISAYFISKYDDILESITKQKLKDEFTKMVNSFRNYDESRIELFDLLDYESVDIYSDVIYFEKQVNTNTDNVIIKFNSKYKTKEANLFKELDIIFKDYENSKEKIELMNSNMSLSTKLTLGNSFDYYFINSGYKTNLLLSSYLVDSITSLDEKSHSLYSEYIFFTELAKAIEIENLTVVQFEIILSNLDELVNSKILTVGQAKIYIKNLFSYQNKDFFGLIDNELKLEILKLESEYLLWN